MTMQQETAAAEGARHGSFGAGARWPVSPAALAALADLDLADETVARYFGVKIAAVRSLRRVYGIGDRSGRR